MWTSWLAVVVKGTESDELHMSSGSVHEILRSFDGIREPSLGMAAAAHTVLPVCCRRYDSGQMRDGDVVTLTRATDGAVAVGR